MKKAKTTAGVIRVAERAANALKDLYEDAHTVTSTRDAARGYLQGLPGMVEEIEKFIAATKRK